MPARTKKSGRLAKRRLGKPRFKFGKSLFLLLTALVVLPVLGFAILFKTSFWGRGERLGLAYVNESGDVVVSNFDPKLGTVAKITIPKDTEVKVSRSLGKWRIGSLIQLGENEKLGGLLLSETVTRCFKMPTAFWSSGEKSNLSWSDRVFIPIFSALTKPGARISIDTVNIGYVKKSKLSDGKLGYVRASDKLPFEISTIFADSDISSEALTIEIENKSGKKTLGSEMGGIIEVMGAKISSLQTTEVADSDCVIYGKKSTTRKRLSKIFSCKISDKLKDQGNFDLVIQIGTEFARRF